jgi:hypothetical protein
VGLSSNAAGYTRFYEAMNSVNQDPWVTESSTVDDFGVVELLLKSFDSAEVVSSGDHCWTPISGSDVTVIDTNFTHNSSSKLGYEAYSLPSLSSAFKQTIKQEPSDDTCVLSGEQQLTQTLDVGIQCSTALPPHLQQFPAFQNSAHLPR